MVILLGPGLALAFVMHLLAGFIARNACRVIGRNAFLTLFGWLGTIVHEGGHALCCLIFGHRITAMIATNLSGCIILSGWHGGGREYYYGEYRDGYSGHDKHRGHGEHR